MPSKITNIQRKIILGLVRSQEWENIEHVRDLLLEQWRTDRGSGVDAYSELKNLHTVQGKIEGLEQFFEILERQNND